MAGQSGRGQADVQSGRGQDHGIALGETRWTAQDAQATAPLGGAAEALENGAGSLLTKSRSHEVTKLPRMSTLADDFTAIVACWDLPQAPEVVHGEREIYRLPGWGGRLRINLLRGTFNLSGILCNQYAVQTTEEEEEEEPTTYASVVIPIGAYFGRSKTVDGKSMSAEERARESVAAIKKKFQESQDGQKTVMMGRLALIFGAAQRVTQEPNGDNRGRRTLWSDASALGKGFHRETGEPADHVVIFPDIVEEKAEKAKVVSRPWSKFEIVTKSSDYKDMLTLGSSLSIDGWGPSADVAMRSVGSLNINTRTIVAVASMSYVSEPISVPNLTTNTDLTEVAKRVLRSQGPVEFHKRYGSHFIGGYTLGGSFQGKFCMEFNTTTSASSKKGSVKNSFDQWGLKAGASAEFQREITRMKEVTRVWGEYQCEGWSGKVPPKAISEAYDLAEAFNSFNTQDGRKMEAVLCRYSDIPAYAEALEEYLEGKDKSKVDAELDDFLIKEENYACISAALNSQFMRVYYIEQIVKESLAMQDETLSDSREQLEGVLTDASNTRELFRRKLRFDPIDEIRENFKALEIFLIRYSGKIDRVGVKPQDMIRWQRGQDLWGALCRADELEMRLDDALPHRAQPPPEPKHCCGCCAM